MLFARIIYASCSSLLILFHSTFQPDTRTCRFLYLSGFFCASQSIIELNGYESEESFEITESKRKSPQYIRRLIISEIDDKELGTIKEMPKSQRNELIKKFVYDKGIYKSALERATGISRETIIRVCKEM